MTIMTTTASATSLVRRMQNLHLDLGNIPAFSGRAITQVLLTNPGVPAEVRQAVIDTCGAGAHRWMTKTLLRNPELTRKEFDAISKVCIENLEVIPNSTAADILPEVLSNPGATEPMLREAFSLVSNQRETLLTGLISHPRLPGNVFHVFFDATAKGVWPKKDEALREFCFSNIVVDNMIADFNKPGSFLPSFIANQVVKSMHFGGYPLADQVDLMDYQVTEAPKRLSVATTAASDLVKILSTNKLAHPDVLLHVWNKIRSEAPGWNQPTMRVAVDALVRNGHFPQSSINVEDLDLSHDLSHMSLYNQERALIDYNLMDTDHGAVSVDVRTFINLDPRRTNVPEDLRLDFVKRADRLLLAMIIRNAPEVSMKMSDAILDRLLSRALRSTDDVDMITDAVVHLPVSAEALGALAYSLTRPDEDEHNLISAILMHPHLTPSSRANFLKELDGESRESQSGIIAARDAITHQSASFLERRDTAQAYLFGRGIASAAGEEKMVKFVNSWMDLLDEVWASRLRGNREDFGVLEDLEPVLLTSVFTDYLQLRQEERTPQHRWLRITSLLGMA